MYYLKPLWFPFYICINHLSDFVSKKSNILWFQLHKIDLLYVSPHT